VREIGLVRCMCMLLSMFVEDYANSIYNVTRSVKVVDQ